MWQGMNHRRFPRANFPCKITIFKKGQKEKISAQTENIGAGGICVLLDAGLDRFSLVDLVLFIENGLQPISCEGRIVWSVKHKDKFDTGIEFITISAGDSGRIEGIVKECLKKEQTSLKKKPA